MSEPVANVNESAADDAGVAPRPRPGFRSRQAPAYEKVRLFAGALRAVLGCVGFFASLLYLPIQMATPVLAGVSILMMVTGSTTVWRALSDAPHLKILTRVVVAVCALATLTTVVLTMTLGAGSLGPLKNMKADAQRDRPPEVRFEVVP